MEVGYSHSDSQRGASNLPPLDRRCVIPSLAPGCSSVLSQQLSSEIGRSQGQKTAMENSFGVQESQGGSVSGEDLCDWCQELHAPWSQNAETGCKGQSYKRVKPRPHHQAGNASLLSEPTGTGRPQMATPLRPRFIHHSTEHRAWGSDWFLQPPFLTSQLGSCFC